MRGSINHYLLRRGRSRTVPLDKCSEQLSEGRMKRTGCMRFLLRVPLCATLALSFLAMTLAQPGVHAVAKAGATASSIEQLVHEASGLAEAHHGHGHRHAHEPVDTAGGSSDNTCDVQCAPASAVPVDGFGLRSFVARCYAAPAFSKLGDGIRYDLIRPPKSLA
jgi:hypothetical protein